MNEEIIKLAKGFPDLAQAMHYDIVPELVIEDFYRAAYNAGLEAAAKRTDQFAILNVEHDGVVHVLTHLTSAIRALEMK